MMRLNKYLAWCGFGSRRNCESLIQSGRVAVDGNIIKSLGTTVDEKKVKVTVDEKPVSPPEQSVYILLNKPIGYVTTVNDELGRDTVMDLLPDCTRVFPVGRLDKNSSGALLLTNDGELAFRLMHPRFRVDKIYRVNINKPITDRHIRKLESGIFLEEGLTNRCSVKIVQQDRKKLEIILHEGRKRQIRRMLNSLGYRVLSLERIQFATLSSSTLKAGQWRYLSDQEIKALKTLCLNSNE